MKKSVYIFVVTILCLSASFIFLNSCKQKITDIEEEETEIIPFSHYTLDKSCRWAVRSLPTTVRIINSNQELEKLIYCYNSNYQEIDFSTNSLLLVYGAKTIPIYDIPKVLFKKSQNKYELDIEMTLLRKAWYRQYWTVALITNKMNDDSKIEVNVIPIEDNREPDFLELETGTYFEPCPVTNPAIMGRTKIEFIDHERLALTRYYGKEGSERRVLYKYEINGYTIKLIYELTGGYEINYFRIINRRKFELEYQYGSTGEIPDPTMIFEKVE